MIRNMKRSPADRFWERVYKNDGDGCWEWTGGLLLPSGYGSFWYEGKTIAVHRFSWVLHFGPIPQSARPLDFCVCHTCDNPLCVRPDHLFMGSHTDNMRDRQAKGRAPRQDGEHNTGSKLTAEQVLEIKRNPEIPSKVFAVKFGVNTDTIWLIRKGKTWTTVNP